MATSNLLEPDSVAVIGASATVGKLGHTVLRNIIDSGFPGKIFPVNPRGGEILGLKATASISLLPDAPGLAVIITPAVSVPDVVTECGRAGVPLAVIISGGFAESGEEGEMLQKETILRAREENVRIIGPNCQGINLPHLPLCATWPLLVREGKIALISQSGTIGAEMMDRLQIDGLGFSAFISLGNRADLDETDFIRYFQEHDPTAAIALYLEGVKNGPGFRRAVESCKKPLVFLKAGRTESGRRAIISHTRSLAGRYEIWKAFFRQSKVMAADTIDDFYHFSKAAAYLDSPSGKRLLVITSSGGSGVLATDRAAERGFVLPAPSDEAGRLLAEKLPPNAIIGNPLDFTGDATAEHYRDALRVLEGEYDYTMAIFGDPIPGAAESVAGRRRLLVVCLGGGDLQREESGKMAAAGMPVFPSPEIAVECLFALSAADRSGGR